MGTYTCRLALGWVGVCRLVFETSCVGAARIELSIWQNLNAANLLSIFRCSGLNVKRRIMQKIETPDGFSKAAESMRSLAATTDDQTEKDAILSVANTGTQQPYRYKKGSKKWLIQIPPYSTASRSIRANSARWPRQWHWHKESPVSALALKHHYTFHSCLRLPDKRKKPI